MTALSRLRPALLLVFLLGLSVGAALFPRLAEERAHRGLNRFLSRCGLVLIHGRVYADLVEGVVVEGAVLEGPSLKARAARLVVPWRFILFEWGEVELFGASLRLSPEPGPAPAKRPTRSLPPFVARGVRLKLGDTLLGSFRALEARPVRGGLWFSDAESCSGLVNPSARTTELELLAHTRPWVFGGLSAESLRLTSSPDQIEVAFEGATLQGPALHAELRSGWARLGRGAASVHLEGGALSPSAALTLGLGRQALALEHQSDWALETGALGLGAFGRLPISALSVREVGLGWPKRGGVLISEAWFTEGAAQLKGRLLGPPTWLVGTFDLALSPAWSRLALTGAWPISGALTFLAVAETPTGPLYEGQAQGFLGGRPLRAALRLSSLDRLTGVLWTGPVRGALAGAFGPEGLELTLQVTDSPLRCDALAQVLPALALDRQKRPLFAPASPARLTLRLEEGAALQALRRPGDGRPQDDTLALPCREVQDEGPGLHQRLDLPGGPVHVWGPDRVGPPPTSLVLYLHGYGIDADGAFARHRLAEQFAASGLDALFLVPECPRRRSDEVQFPSLDALLGEVRQAQIPLSWGPVAAVGHSGAYRTVVEWLESGRLTQVALLDGLYSGQDELAAFLEDEPSHRVLALGMDTYERARRLANSVNEPVILRERPARLSEALKAARLLVVRGEASHFELVEDGETIAWAIRWLKP